MNDFIHCILLNHVIGSNPEQEIAEKLKEILDERNTKGIQISRALNEIGITNVKQLVIGPNSIAILCEDGGVRRIGFQTKVQQIATSSGTTPATNQSTNNASAQSSVAACAARSAAKFRRVMLSGSFRRGERAGVIIDRGRPILPASAVPEDLVAQAQVVLQGKSRDVIIRELQRTNLNVNEAVNNLLSRDDDEDDGEESAGEVVLPEELLSLLDPTSHNLLDASDLYSDFDYIQSRDVSRKQRDKDRKSKDGSSSSVPTTTNREELDGAIQPWNENGLAVPNGVKKFVKIVATRKELFAISGCGKVFAWPWSSTFGENEVHIVAQRLIPESEFVCDINASSLRVVVTTKSGKVASWLTHSAIGSRACQATEIKATQLPLLPEENIVEIAASNHLAVVRTSHCFYWCGLYPFADRPKIWEKERAKSRKHVTFETNASEVKEGVEVRTKACPIYSAGSVAVNMNGANPMIGVLMESVWTLSEVCRFRILEPGHYDSDFPGQENSPSTCATLPGPGESRKRRASSDVFNATPSPREEPWGISDVVWIHEQYAQDVAVVKIVDNAYVGIEYLNSAGDMTYASSLSGSLGMKENNAQPTGKIRLLRKDDLCVVTPKLKSSRSPRVMQKEPYRFTVSGGCSRRILSFVADSTGVRALVEKKNKLYVTRIAVNGKVLSEHPLPIHLPSAFGPDGKAPSLLNYGEDYVLFLRDGNGALVPLVRDAARGFKEPAILNLPAIQASAINVSIHDAATVAKTVSRKVSVALISAPSEPAVQLQLPSLIQTVLYCSAEGVQRLLTKYLDCGDPDIIKAEVLDARSDGGANVLHTALRIAVAKKNKDDIDSGTIHGLRLREEDTRMAREEARDLEQKWQRLIRQNRVEASQRETDTVIQPVLVENEIQRSEPQIDALTADLQNDDLDSIGSAVSDAKERQKGAIEVIKVIIEHPATCDILLQMLSHRDYDGLTPFQAAINMRAFGAAAILWGAIEMMQRDEQSLIRMVNPPGSRPDDSPLFLLCYNDTCSFSWTGEEHINQDIFECRTCGLVGSLCCCTECAFTCHRNHDCKLKKTSPTAYCDCWEKCPCKALIAGNQEKREFLLRTLLKNTRLHELTNNRGEHLLLFLARTYGRQQNEQAHYNRRKAHAVPQESANTPEHDLEPPKFARFALDVCLNEWSVVKSLVNIGIRKVPSEPVFEDVINLNSQHGSTHLDKFVFVLFSKCSEQAAVKLVDSMIMAANVSDKSREADVDQVIERFARSAIRLYTLCVLLSPVASSVAVRGASQPVVQQQEKRGNSIQVNISGFFSLVRNDNKSQEPKVPAVALLVSRLRSALIRLAPYAVKQAAFAADSLLTPVRLGVLRSAVMVGLTGNQDVLEVLEKFFNSESDLTTHLLRTEEIRDKQQRKRKISRRETDRGDDDDHRRDDSDGDSDSDDDGHSSRRHNSQSGMEDGVLDLSVGTSEPSQPRRKNGISEVLNEDDTDETSSDSESDDDEEGHVLIDLDENIDDEETDEAGEQGYEPSSPRNEQDNSAFSLRENDVFMNDPDNDDENTGDGERDPPQMGIRTMNNIRRPIDDPPGQRIGEEQQEEQDNTRDAVLSETSSADQPDAGEELLNRVRGNGRNGNARTGRGRRSRNSASTMDWTRRTLHIEDEWEELNVRDRSRPQQPTQNNNASNNTNNVVATATASSAVSPSDKNKKGTKGDEPIPTLLQASIQMSTGFSFVIRLIVDLMISAFNPNAERSNITLNLKKDIVNDMIKELSIRLDSSWTWLFTSMDRMEAQLLFGNAVMMNAAGELRPKQQRKKEQSKRDKASEDPNTAALRRETLSYVIGTMRAQSKEAGDDYPLIEVDTLRTLVFVFDAYLLLQETIANYNKKQCSSGERDKRKEDSANPAIVTRFFRRSESLCYPGALCSDAWDTLGKTSSQIPLAEKSHLLVPDTEKDTLFAPSQEPVSLEQYIENNQKLGTAHVMHMSLSAPSESTSDITPKVEDTGMDIDNQSSIETITVESLRESLKSAISTPLNIAMSRWKNVLIYMSKECHQDLLETYGGEPTGSHLLLDVAGFPAKQKIFRATLDKVRNAQAKDIVLEVHRDSIQLIRETIYQLNKTHIRRLHASKGKDSSLPVMSCGRVKVRFHDEPGEGSGVARSFYTALAEGLQSLKTFPFDTFGWEGDEYLYGSSTDNATPVAPVQQPQPGSNTRERSSIGRIALIRERGTSTILSRRKGLKRYPLNISSAPFYVDDVSAAELRVASSVLRTDTSSPRPDEPARDRQMLAEALFCKVRSLKPTAVHRIAGMLIEVPTGTVYQIVNNQDTLRSYVDDAINLMLQAGFPSDLALLTSAEDRMVTQPSEHPESDEFPLFARSCRRGFVVPVPGNLSPMRLNAFRNVGRIIGMCLAQGELFPLKLCRHVYKYILGRPINWLDLQFYDPQLFNVLRQIIVSEEEEFEAMGLNFSDDSQIPDSTQPSVSVELKPNGENIPVKKSNVIEYIYRLVEWRLLGPKNISCLQAIKHGVSDVLPLDSLKLMSAEDLKLMLCGSELVCISTLQSYTSFSDESHSSAETIEKFKDWFWSVFESLNNQEKQELIFFWTGAPSLPPATLHPHPTVMVRPPDDIYLPTANTCISRLYVPLYSSKRILKNKLLLAIKAKNFGFV